MADEKRFEEALKRWLESEGIYPLGTDPAEMNVPPCGYWEKRWGGAKYIKSGMPDMHVVVCGTSVEIELKGPSGRASEMQKQKLSQIADAGCMGFVAKPKDFRGIKELILAIKENKGKDLDSWIETQEMYGLERVVYRA